jgi:hypothetical protein
MQPKSGKPGSIGALSDDRVELSRAAQMRLGWMDFYRRTENVALTCRHFAISRQTFCRWQRRYQPLDLTSLEERSHCPHHRRQPRGGKRRTILELWQTIRSPRCNKSTN